MVNFSMEIPTSSLKLTKSMDQRYLLQVNNSAILYSQQELKYNLHFWIGQYSTQDEYGTAAYKTVELDTLVNLQ